MFSSQTFSLHPAIFPKIPQIHEKNGHLLNEDTRSLQQGYKDSNLELTESESVALPFGDSPLFTFAVFPLKTSDII